MNFQKLASHLLTVWLSSLITIQLFCSCIGISCAQEKSAQSQGEPGRPEPRKPDLDAILSDIVIVPGEWRPHFPWEQIAWIKQPFNSHDYVWLDFPEALFTNGRLTFLSHISPRLAQPFSDLPPVPWKKIPGGLAFERTLPNRITFGGSLVKASGSMVALTLYVRNGTERPLTDIRLQTCAFLRLAKEFSSFTTENKFVHVSGEGWISYTKAQEMAEGSGKYRLRWDGGNVADRPTIVTVAGNGKPDASQRLIALTWDKDTYMLFANPKHPCMHADPWVPDIAPGGTATVHGRLIFFQGTLEQLWNVHFKERH